MLGAAYAIGHQSNVVGMVSTNDCKSIAFTDLQLSADQAFEEDDHKKSLELFQRVYRLCPTDEMTKEMIVDLKKDVGNGR